MKIALIIIVLLVGLLLYRFIKLGKQSQEMEVELGLQDGRLKPCASLLNCVISYDQDYFEPIKFESSPISKIKSILEAMNCNIVKTDDQYLQATFQSKLFGFVDDIEFHFHEGTLHFRSSSRVGKSDLGANRKRIEKILSQLKGM